MKDIRYEDWLFKACRSTLGKSDTQILTALFLIQETRCLLGAEASTIDEREAYQGMLRQCEILKIDNPFSDFNVFIQVYHMADGIEKADWEVMLSLEMEEYMHIPQGVFKMMSEQLQPETETVLIAEGQKFAPFLKGLVKQYSYCRYLITTESYIYAIILKDIFRDYSNVTIQQTSIYEYEFLQSKFDIIMSLPAMGRRNMVDVFSRFICREYEMVALENLLLHLAPGGKLAIIMPARITFGGGRVEALRSFVQEMYNLEEISELPGGIFANTGIKTNLLFISTGATEDVTIKRYGFTAGAEGKGKNVLREIVLLDESFVVSSELFEQGDWNLDKLFARQDEEWIRFMERGSRIRLREGAQVFRGKNISRKSDTGNVGVLNISNLGEYAVKYNEMEYIDEAERKITNYILEDGDVLLPARGTAIRVAVFEKQEYPCIASSNLIVIRPRQDLLSSIYLKMFLDSPLGAKILASAQQGTTVVNLSYRDLQEIEIPFLPLETQKELADDYKKELKIYTEAINAAENRWKTALEKLQAML